MNADEVEARLDAVTAPLAGRPADLPSLRARLGRRRRERRLAAAGALAVVVALAVAVPVVVTRGRGEALPATAPVVLHEVDQPVSLPDGPAFDEVSAAEGADGTVYVVNETEAPVAHPVYSIPADGPARTVGSLGNVSGIAVGASDLWAHVDGTVVELDLATGRQVHVWTAPAHTEIDGVVAAGDAAWVQLDVPSLDPRLVRLDADGSSADRTPPDYFGSVPSAQADGTAYVLSNTHLVRLGPAGLIAQTSRGGPFAEADQVLGVVDGRVVVFTGERDDGAGPARLRAYDPVTLHLVHTVTYAATTPSYAVDGSGATTDAVVATASEVVAVDATAATGASAAAPVDLGSGHSSGAIALRTGSRALAVTVGSPANVEGTVLVGPDLVVGLTVDGGGHLVGVRRVVVS